MGLFDKFRKANKARNRANAALDAIDGDDREDKYAKQGLLDTDSPRAKKNEVHTKTQEFLNDNPEVAANLRFHRGMSRTHGKGACQTAMSLEIKARDIASRARDNVVENPPRDARGGSATSTEIGRGGR